MFKKYKVNYLLYLLKRFSGLLVSKPDKPNGSWELVEQPNDQDSKCDCKRLKKTKVGID